MIFFIAGSTYAAINLTAQKPAEHSSLTPGINLAQGEKGLIGWWKLNGNTKDSTPYGNDGQVVGTVTPAADRKGTASGAMAFSNQNYIHFSQHNLPTAAITVSLWAEQSALANYYNLVTNNWPQEGGWDIWTDAAGTLHFGVYHAGAQHQATCTAGTFTTNSWHHVVGTYDGTTAKVYLDNHLCGSVAVATTLTNSTAWSIADGTHPGLAAYEISDVRIYNRALSASDITNLYNSYNSQVNLYSPPGSGGSVNLTAGLVAYLPFNGNTRDATPFGNNAGNHGATLTADRFGRPNSAYQFNGSSAYMQIPHSSSLDIGQPGLTLSAWIKPDVLSGTNTYAVITRNAPFLLWVNPAVAAVQTGLYQNSTWYFSNSSSNSLAAGVWQNIVLTYDGTYRRMYVNGVQSGADITTIAGNIDINSTTNLAIGYDYATGGRYYFPGDIDDIRVYNRALSAAEVQALYNLPD
ncbi:MAG TPA: LamG domain-containing protein [Candidatus Saccharimonadales bacterium]|nr:LamG domain-containing protein [Candidatus Saccharimonadales bacterium]